MMKEQMMKDIMVTASSLIDIMNAFLILTCAVFVLVITSTLRNKKLKSLARSAHFLKIEEIITAWTLIGSAILLLAVVEIIYSFGIVYDVRAYKLFKTIFGAMLAIGLFIQARLLLKYIKQIKEKTIKQ